MDIINKEFSCELIYNNPEKYNDLLYYSGYLIYRIHNIITDKSYIGDTFINLYERLFRAWDGGHFGCYENDIKKHLYNSMRKYGLDKFFISIIYSGNYDYDLEEYYIRKYDSYINGYNNSPNGKGVNSGYTTDCMWINNGIHEILFPDGLDIPIGYVIGRLNFHPRLNCTLFYDKLGNEIVVPNNQVEQHQRLNPDHIKGRLTPWVENSIWVTNGKYDRRIPENQINEFLTNNPSFQRGMAVGHTLGKVSVWNDINKEFTLVNEDFIDEYVKLYPGSYRCSPNEGRVHITDGKIDYSMSPEEANKFIELNPSFRYGHSYSPTLGKKWVNNGKIRRYIDKEELDQFLLENPEYHLGFSLD